MAVDKACAVGLDVDVLVVVGYKLAGVGLVLDIVASEDPQNMRYSVFRVVDSLWDVFA